MSADVRARSGPFLVVMVFLLRDVSRQAQQHAYSQIGHVDGFQRIGATAKARLRGMRS
jgi:hypothetical protein